MAKFDVETFVALVKDAKKNQEAAISQEETKIANAAPHVAVADARGQANASAKAAEVQAAAANELSTADNKLGVTPGDQRVKAERQMELLAGQQVQAQASAEQEAETVIAAPTNAPTVLSKAASKDQMGALLARVHDLLAKEASDENLADEAQKTAEEAIAYGRLMALGFLQGMNEALSSEGAE